MKKTTFTKILFLGTIIFSVFALSSCKKNSDNPSSGYYVKFKLDGNEKQYTETTAAVFNTTLPVYSCALVGEKLISGTVYEGMGINIFNDAAIAANVTYTDAEVASIGAPQATLLYTDSTGAQASSATAISPNVQVVITQMDASSVTGTFSGSISSLTGSSTQTVTEGTFHLPRF
jgi:hypothetical protein